MKIDSDGFMHLQWRKDEPKKKNKKSKKIKFKKGSWKDNLYRAILKIRKPKNVEKFHDKAYQNIVLKKSKYNKTNSPTTLKKDDVILIDSDNDMYMKLTSTAYNKLSKVRRIAFDYTLKSIEDFEDDYSTIYNDMLIIHDINSLCSNLNYFRQLVDGISELQALTCGFTHFKLIIHVLVYKEDNIVESYKNINKFIEAYSLGSLL